MKTTSKILLATIGVIFIVTIVATRLYFGDKKNSYHNEKYQQSNELPYKQKIGKFNKIVLVGDSTIKRKFFGNRG